MEFTQLTKEEYIEFTQKSTQATFLNAYAYIEMKEKNGAETELLGVKKNGSVIAATGIVYLKTKKIFTYAYAPRGFVMDYDDEEVISFFTENIRSYLAKKNVIYLMMEPFVLLQKRDRFGNIEGVTHHDRVDRLKKYGYLHQGYTVGISYANVRFMYVVDIPYATEKELFDSFERNARRGIESAKKYHVHLRKMTREELPEFYNVMMSTEKRRNYRGRDLKYYQDMWDAFSQIDGISYRCCEMNVKEALMTTSKEIRSLENEISEIKSKNENLSKKQINKIHEKENQLSKENKRYEELQNILDEKGETIILSAGMWYEYAHEYLCLISGVYEEYMNFGGPHMMHYAMMKEIVERKDFNRYNFYGISGDFSKEAIDAGVLAFKQSFGGHIEELLGDFHLVIQPMKYKLIMKL